MGPNYLLELCEPIFMRVYKLVSGSDKTEYKLLRDSLRNAIDSIDDYSVKVGWHRDVIENAKFSMTAFVDETILSSTWDGRDEWEAQSLQVELYGESQAGEGFYQRLDQMLLRPEIYIDAIEVFYVSLRMGYEGKYRLADSNELRVLEKNLFLQIGLVRGEKSTMFHLEDSNAAVEEKNYCARPPFAVSCGLILLIFIGGYSYYYLQASRDEDIAIGKVNMSYSQILKTSVASR